MTDTLSRSTIETVDPQGKGAIPTCPVCASILRRDMDTGTRRCDTHGIVVAWWMPYEKEETR